MTASRMLRITLLSDGSSDKAFLPVIRWTVGQHTDRPVNTQWADLGRLPDPPKTLNARIKTTLELYPCELLIIHRDAESQPAEQRHQEIQAALDAPHPQHIALVPVRMLEAWLLHDEPAIRRAADCPAGHQKLNLPGLRQLEKLSDPKAVLHTALRAAHCAHGRRARRFKPHSAIHRVADLITDWSPLRSLSAFNRFEADTKRALEQLEAEHRTKS